MPGEYYGEDGEFCGEDGEYCGERGEYCGERGACPPEPCGVAPRPGDAYGGEYDGVSGRQYVGMGGGEYVRPGESEARRLVPPGTGGDHDRARLPAAPCGEGERARLAAPPAAAVLFFLRAASFVFRIIFDRNFARCVPTSPSIAGPTDPDADTKVFKYIGARLLLKVSQFDTS